MSTLAFFVVFLWLQFEVWEIGLIWILPVLIVGEPVHKLIELPEHTFCNKGSADVFQNTRSVRSNPFMTWLTNGNNFHVEHHQFPSVPIDGLSSLYRENTGRHVFHSTGYRQFYMEYVEKLFRSFRMPRGLSQEGEVFRNDH